MTRYGIVLIISVAITAIHRLWNNAPVNKVNLFILSDQKQDIQWYIKDSFDMLSGWLITWVLWKVSKSVSRRLSDIVLLLLIYKTMNFVGYWINFNANDYYYIYAIIPIGLVIILFNRK